MGNMVDSRLDDSGLIAAWVILLCLCCAAGI